MNPSSQVNATGANVVSFFRDFRKQNTGTFFVFSGVIVGASRTRPSGSFSSKQGVKILFNTISNCSIAS
jgi:hypothetical protein